MWAGATLADSMAAFYAVVFPDEEGERRGTAVWERKTSELVM